MAIRNTFLAVAILMFVCAGAAFAEDTEPPPPMPPLPPIVIESPPPMPIEAPTVQDFDRSVASVCEPCDPCARPCTTGYGGFNLQAFPGLGFGVEFGMWYTPPSGCARWAWEVGISYQDLTDGFNGVDTQDAGKWAGLRVGVKASFRPQSTSHPTLRGGLAWNAQTGEQPDKLDVGDLPSTGPLDSRNFFGGYLGVGWEWDLFGGRVTTGPEIFGFAGFPDNGPNGAYTITGTWHFLFNF